MNLDSDIKILQHIMNAGENSGSNVTYSNINGNIKVDDEELKVYDDTKVLSDITNLNNRSVIGRNGLYYYANGANQDMAITASTNINTLLANRNTNMIVDDNGFILLEKGKSFNIIFNISKRQTSNGTSGILSVEAKEGTVLNSSGIMASNSPFGVPLVFVTPILSEDIYVGFYYNNSVSIMGESSYISIQEASNTYIKDPVKYAQDYETEELLFTSDTPITSGDIPLDKSLNNYDSLHFVFEDYNSAFADEFQVDTIMETSNNNWLVSSCVSGFITFFYKNNDTLSIIRSNNNYGITKIVGKKSRTPVCVNYHSAGLDKTILFEGNANTSGTYELTDSVKNYDSIRLLVRFYKDTNKNFETIEIDTEFINSDDASNAFVRGFSSSTDDHRYISYNFSQGYDKITISYISNSSASDIALKCIIGIKSKYNNNSSEESTYTDEEVNEAIDEILNS